jgi:hypothetical protein
MGNTPGPWRRKFSYSAIGLPRNEEMITSNPGPAVGMGLCQDSRQTVYAVGGQ